MDNDTNRKLELLLLTRQQDYQDLSAKMNNINKQLGARMDALIARFEELNQKMLVLTKQ
jgi:hypothetical protein